MAAIDLHGKVALVTGGTSGIGRATAVRFAQAGAKVVVAGRRPAEGAEVVAAIVGAGGTATFIRTDVTQEADVKALVEGTLAEYGRLDVAFNNAGLEQSPMGPITETSLEAYRTVMDVNVLGVWLALKYEIPALLRTGGGAIVNTSSVAGHIGMAGAATYIAAKHAVEGLTKSVALEFATQGIRVNAVAPAAIVTDMMQRFVGGSDTDMGRYLAGLHPVGRMGRAEEVADAVLYLVSPAASFTTGISLPVDGGWLAK
jgi:NAD(P)-dependent dehydrogenase (short-subunit alcohol dehydrogenase family)